MVRILLKVMVYSIKTIYVKYIYIYVYLYRQIDRVLIREEKIGLEPVTFSFYISLTPIYVFPTTEARVPSNPRRPPCSNRDTSAVPVSDRLARLLSNIHIRTDIFSRKLSYFIQSYPKRRKKQKRQTNKQRKRLNK